MRYALTVIVSFRHKGLRQLYESGSKRGVQATHVKRLRRLLTTLDQASGPPDLAQPSLGAHPLKGEREGCWSVWITGNWRLTFRFKGADVELLDYEHYH